jgi:hypothetical protein
MSVREIIEQLDGLTAAELNAIKQQISELASRRTTGVASPPGGRVLHAERTDGRLVLTGAEVVRQAEVNAILDEFP